jgi:hypothetical protein
MGEHRSRIGAALLASVAVFGAAGASTAASNVAGWDDPIVIGLLALALICLIAALVAFRPVRSGNAEMNHLMHSQFKALKRRRLWRRLFRRSASEDRRAVISGEQPEKERGPAERPRAVQKSLTDQERVELVQRASARGVDSTSDSLLRRAAGPPAHTPQVVHVPTSHYESGKVAAEAGMSPLERWLKGRVEEAARNRRERSVLGDRAWQGAMHKWEAENVQWLLDNYPSLVKDYQGDPPGHQPGLQNEEAFYERQADWLRTTLRTLATGEEAVESAPTRVDLLQDQYRQGRSLQRRLVWAAGIPESPEQAREAEDRARAEACRWGHGSWQVVGEHFPGYESDFFGDGDLALGSTGFALACQREIERLGGSANSFLERKLVFIADLLKRYDK